MRRLGLVVGLCSSVCLAQSVTAKVAPFPLKVRQAPSDFGAKERADLQAEFVRVLRDEGVRSPSSFDVTEGLARTKRQDCDLEDGCLVALALATDSLYATYVELAWDLKDTIVATGRVVRADGAVTVPQKTVSMKVAGKTSFGVAAKTVLKRLVSEEMRLQGLPAAKAIAVEPPRPVLDAGVAVVAAPVDAGTIELPPPPPPLVQAGPPVGRIVGYSAVGVGGAGVAVGLVMWLTGMGAVQAQLGPSGQLSPEGNAQSALNGAVQQRIGVGVLAVGAAVAAAGVVTLLLTGADSPKTTWWWAPVPGGAAVGLGGVFP